jgi:hypothetical protein
MRSALTSTGAGIAVAAIGLVALAAVIGAAPSEDAAPAPVVATPAPLIADTVPERTTSVEPIAVSVAAPTPGLDGIGDAVARVLYGSGYATHTAQADLEADLPPAVLALLIDREVTLTIATEGESTDQPGEAP